MTAIARTGHGKRVLRAHELSTGRLARLREILVRHVGEGRLPGLVALVARRGEEHVEALGAMAFGDAAPMRRDTIFRLASAAKPITAVAALLLVEECRIRLDDPVDDWLPELAGRPVLRAIDGRLDDTVPARRQVTLRDLLTFRSGDGEVRFVAGDCPMARALAAAELPLVRWPFAGTNEDFVRRLGKLPLACQPGERWLYHMGAEILGVLVARVAGTSLGAFLRDRIFDPLGMKDTGFYVPEERIDRLATSYRRDVASGRLVIDDEPRGGRWSRAPVFESGAGGLVSTVDDLAAFGRMLLHHGVLGRERILARPTVEAMLTDQLSPEEKARSPFFPNLWETRGWGLGISVVTRRDDVARGPGTFGWDGAFGTSLYVDPREELVGVFLANRSPDELAIPPSVRDFWTATYQALDD